jgi:hypothetical protein
MPYFLMSRRGIINGGSVVATMEMGYTLEDQVNKLIY